VIEGLAAGELTSELTEEAILVWIARSGQNAFNQILNAVRFPAINPIGMLAAGAGIDLVAFISNMVPVTLGNIGRGGGFVALTYCLVYLRPRSGNRESCS
jgi:hypothetical protein